MCSCCGDDFSSGEKKKRRRQLSTQYGKKLLEILIKLMLEQQNNLDFSKLSEGYLCRYCATLLDKYDRLQQQLSVKIKGVVPHMPLVVSAEHHNVSSEDSGDCPTSVPQLLETTAPSTSESPPVVVSIIYFNCY